MRVNFQNPLFSYRFKRSPKIWTIDMIHELWERSIDRAALRQSEIKKVFKKIIEEIPKNSSGGIVVYFNEPKSYYKDSIQCYKIRYSREYKTHFIGTDVVKFKGSVSEIRDQKIDFLLANERAFELGQEYHEIKKLDTSLHYRVRNILTEILNDKLRSHFEKLDTIPPDIFTLKIGDKDYYIISEKDYKYHYPKFEIGGVVTESLILND